MKIICSVGELADLVIWCEDTKEQGDCIKCPFLPYCHIEENSDNVPPRIIEANIKFILETKCGD